MALGKCVVERATEAVGGRSDTHICVDVGSDDGCPGGRLLSTACWASHPGRHDKCMVGAACKVGPQPWEPRTSVPAWTLTAPFPTSRALGSLAMLIQGLQAPTASHANLVTTWGPHTLRTWPGRKWGVRPPWRELAACMWVYSQDEQASAWCHSCVWLSRG